MLRSNISSFLWERSRHPAWFSYSETILGIDPNSRILQMSSEKCPFSDIFPDFDFTSIWFGQYLPLDNRGLTYLGEVGYIAFFLFGSHKSLTMAPTLPQNNFSTWLRGKEHRALGHTSGLCSVSSSVHLHFFGLFELDTKDHLNNTYCSSAWREPRITILKVLSSSVREVCSQRKWFGQS